MPHAGHHCVGRELTVQNLHTPEKKPTTIEHLLRASAFCTGLRFSDIGVAHRLRFRCLGTPAHLGCRALLLRSPERIDDARDEFGHRAFLAKFRVES